MDRIDNELTASHARVAQAFHEGMDWLIAGMFLLFLAVLLSGASYGWWRHRNEP